MSEMKTERKKGGPNRFSSFSKNQIIREKITPLLAKLRGTYPDSDSLASLPSKTRIRAMTKANLTNLYIFLEQEIDRLDAEKEWQEQEVLALKNAENLRVPERKPKALMQIPPVPARVVEPLQANPRKGVKQALQKLGSGIKETAFWIKHQIWEALCFLTGTSKLRKRPADQTLGAIGFLKVSYRNLLFGGVPITPEERERGVIGGTSARWRKWLTGRYPPKYVRREIARAKTPIGLWYYPRDGIHTWAGRGVALVAAIVLPALLVVGDLVYSNAILFKNPLKANQGMMLMWAMMVVSGHHLSKVLQLKFGLDRWAAIISAGACELLLQFCIVQSRSMDGIDLIGFKKGGGKVMLACAVVLLVVNALGSFVAVSHWWAKRTRYRQDLAKNEVVSEDVDTNDNLILDKKENPEDPLVEVPGSKARN